MTTGTKIQQAINRLVRFRQRPAVTRVRRPPIRGTLGTGEAGEAVPTPDVAAQGMVYVPLADEAVHGWGSPFGPNPPMGTVQASWAPANLIYRTIDPSTGDWVVGHQQPNVACGDRYWRSASGAEIISWRAISGWRDLAAGEASVPAGAAPIFQDGNVLTWIDGIDLLFCAVYSNGYLYAAHRGNADANDEKAFVSRTPLALNAGPQAPNWETAGVLEDATDGKIYEALQMDLRDDGLQCLVNGRTQGRNLGFGSSVSALEEYTVDLTWGPPGFAIARTGDSATAAFYDWYSSAVGDTDPAALARMQGSPYGFAFEPSKLLDIPGGFDTGSQIDYDEGTWRITLFLRSWYDRVTQVRQRYTVDLHIGFGQAFDATYTTAQRIFDDLFPGADAVFFCDPNCTGFLRATIGVQNTIGVWVQTTNRTYLRTEYFLRLNGSLVDTLTNHLQEYENSVASGSYRIMASAGSLPCLHDPGPPEVPCGQQEGIPEASQLVTVSPSYQQPPADFESFARTKLLEYRGRKPVFIGSRGDDSDFKGYLIQYGHEYLDSIADNVEQPGFAPGEGRRVRKIRDHVAGGQLIMDHDEAASMGSSSAGIPPSKDNYLAGPRTTEADWATYFQGRIDAAMAGEFASAHDLYQPLLRLPDGARFFSIGVPNGSVDDPATTYDYYNEFSPGDLESLTGLGAVTATNPRYSKLLEDGTTGPLVVIAGWQSVAGIL